MSMAAEVEFPDMFAFCRKQGTGYWFNAGKDPDDKTPILIFFIDRDIAKLYQEQHDIGDQELHRITSADFLEALRTFMKHGVNHFVLIGKSKICKFNSFEFLVGTCETTKEDLERIKEDIRKAFQLMN